MFYDPWRKLEEKLFVSGFITPSLSNSPVAGKFMEIHSVALIPVD